jgi:hypothetical protein
MRIAKFAVAALLIFPAGIAGARQQSGQSGQSSQAAASKQDPIVEAAKQAQERKKDQAKAAKVWDNDNIPSKPGEVSVIGESPAPADASPTADSSAAAPVETRPAPTRAELEANVRDARQRLLTMKTDLDILQRTYDLDNQMYMSKPDYASDKEGAAKMADEKAQVDAKRQEIADLEKKVQDLEGKM